MKKINGKLHLTIASIVCILLSCTSALAEEYWFVRCKNQSYGIDFNIEQKTAFIILRVDEGGTIPAASTTQILRYVNKPNDKHAIFDFGSATKIGVNVSRPDRVIVYRLLQGKTYPVCDAEASIK